MLRSPILAIVLLVCISRTQAQTWQLHENLNGYITDIEIINGQRYTVFKTGELWLGDSLIHTYSVQHGYQETGLLSVCLWQDSICVMSCGIDSIQRIICGTDTLLEVSYKSPWAIRHRAGDMVAIDSVLYASFGYGADPDDAQDTSNFRGKIVAITSDTAYIYAYGLRNGWKIDTADGWLYIADVGSNKEEEIDRIQGAGRNLGWPCIEGNFVLDTTCGETEPPFFTYPHFASGVAIIGGVVYQDHFWFCDNFHEIGGYLMDTTWIKKPCPKYPTGMYDHNDTLYVYDYLGNIYRWEEVPLSIDTTKQSEKPTTNETTLTIRQDEIRWSNNLYGTLRILSIDGKVVRNKEAFEEGYISLDGFVPGIYVLILDTRHGIQWSKTFYIQ